VFRQEIDWDRLPAGTPPALGSPIRGCLERDPRRRLRDIGDARPELSAAAEAPAAGGSAPASARRPWWPTIILAGIAVAAIAAAIVGWRARSGTAPARPTYVSLALPAGWRLTSVPAISRDGRRLAFVASDGVGRPQLWVRELGKPESRRLENTEEAASPFFSPDGE
jgi:eukaryotic-like serine/threonine-protein kinase